MTLVGFYFLCLLAGLIWAAISLIMAGGFSGDSAADIHADHGIDHGDVSGEITFSPMSPTVIAVFITAFGAGGIVAIEGLQWSVLASVGLALGSGLLIAGVVYEVLSIVYKRTQGSSEANVEALIGVTAEVITPIAENSTGEIAYVIRGSRYTGSARSVDGSEIGRNKPVTVVRVTGSTMYVKPLSDEPDEKEE